ncbi:Uncharacterised protein [uncultured Ruminococcus sp.]|nr:Uncharacterised protein [uncultured Ruminococcus sp.]
MLDNIAVVVTVILGGIAHDIDVFGHLVILVFIVNHVVGDFIDLICLTVGFYSICLDCILFIIIVSESFYEFIAVKFLETCLFERLVIGIFLLESCGIYEIIYRSVVIVNDRICNLVIAVCDFAKSAVSVVFVGFSSAGYACCRNQLSIIVVIISYNSVAFGIIIRNAFNTIMSINILVLNCVSSACGISYNSLII